MVPSTMMDYPLSIRHLFEYGRRIFADSEVLTYGGPGDIRRATYAEVGDRADRLAAALARLGVREGDRVGTFCWNNQHHLEAYFAIPCMGAVLHTLNIRLFPEQLAYVVNHAQDKVIIVDASIAPLLGRVRDQLETVEHIITVGEGDTASLGETLDYETLLAAEEPGFAYPDVDERAAAAMCYTSGTTGNPKGVTYSHRSTFLHSFAVNQAANIGFTQDDRCLVIVPMFHANAWGMPYACWIAGSDYVMPQQFLQAKPLAEIIEATRPTVSGAVPTILNDVLHNASDADLSSLRMVVCGGSAVPRSLIEAYEKSFGVRVVQGWGMTETSPLAALSHPPRSAPPEEDLDWLARTGRVLPGVDLRITGSEGEVLPWDGVAQGEIEVRGPWITASYYEVEDPEKFHDGWLRTGDVGTVLPNGFVQISDRAKDVIKSGGEWISSVDLENAIMGHADVVEAAVIGIPDDRWDERPLAAVVVAEGASLTPQQLSEYLQGKVAKWWMPERWTFIDEVPKTSVGKFDKKVLRTAFAKGDLEVQQVG
ncbi:MAG: long-chain fatty acid--CoA ligase [Actinomycetota bacterium]|nr:long-chain fatty acid--CoA ligase [Actinomycetota bacterium]